MQYLLLFQGNSNCTECLSVTLHVHCLSFFVLIKLNLYSYYPLNLHCNERMSITLFEDDSQLLIVRTGKLHHDLRKTWNQLYNRLVVNFMATTQTQ